MVRETVRCVTFVNSALSCQTLYQTYVPMRQLSKTFGGKIVDRPCLGLIPLLLSISLHILHTFLLTFPVVPRRRTC